MESKTVVADIAEELTRRVVGGQYAPSELMMSVRQVADEFDVNRATAQLVLGRLESLGIVAAQRARGFVISDIRDGGGVDVSGYVFRLSQTPGETFEMFRDAVDMERTIVLEALLAYATLEERPDLAVIESGIDDLESIARLDKPDYSIMFEKELGIVRHVLAALHQPFRKAVLNSIGEMILSLPEATAAYYSAEPDVRVLVWRAFVAARKTEAGPSQSQLDLFEDLFNMYHQQVIERFAELVVGGEPDAALDGSVATA
ncbi:phosphonate metabolism transcriptional regulator PhnF [Mycobacteroides abscessus subsp. massiliense]|uniref:GntR family transcriptional regulator n=1 Tax=Mycobacteroides abscessus TaxID=36809 RepID=UPI0003109F1B|nr:GntR family transcriptional regulator [Mycobacteroides abscessus]AMU77304.1 GntR family transcriptional regulator [Mycobacteroides abscessus]ANO26249.1 GntR family transcriptional regulator [Mycobacteroides abscessus]MBN7316781.1 GntR family transcriptional regulator [Mycobacteroides abscessus subsp. massiliense]MBN7320197.1 GntR family transcriptional regulator [Mycobacteroides abscessus subsp. massiliense]RIU33765.1 GntR family transcriptional regulator [Mycobacteroides abscessus]